MREIYLLSGLGADKRVFDYLDISDFKINHIEWIDPLENEAIEHYAKRLLKQIHSVKPILLGVSFGGMMAIEIGKLIETEKIVLISSAKTRNDIPFFFKVVGRLGLNRLIPKASYKRVDGPTFWLFGTKNKEERDLLTSIVHDTDVTFLKWGMSQIMNWKNLTELENVTHIHGTQDRILPFRTADYIIENGGHLMIVNRASEISELVKKILG